MSDDWLLSLLQRLAGIDQTPLFILSLLPYLAFLHWAGRIPAFPRLALRGFQLTLLFVAVTIAAALVAQLRFGQQLADVDALHGGAESLLTLSNLLVLWGFQQGIEAARRNAPLPPPLAAPAAEPAGSSQPDAGRSE